MYCFEITPSLSHRRNLVSYPYISPLSTASIRTEITQKEFFLFLERENQHRKRICDVPIGCDNKSHDEQMEEIVLWEYFIISTSRFTSTQKNRAWSKGQCYCGDII